MSKRYEVVIVGGGSAGMSIAARLAAMPDGPSVALIEPSTKHYYQPIWTLVGGGIFPREVSEREQGDLVPFGVEWIRDRVATFDPDNSRIQLDGGDVIEYGDLVVALGIQCNWGAIKGLQETLGKDGVSSNYSYDTVEATWRFIDGFRGGNALFTFPSTPIKCAGAPQKIMYLAEEHFRRKGVRAKTKVMYMSATAGIFGIPKYKAALEKIVAARGIEGHYRRNLVEVRASSREAVFEHLDEGTTEVVKYDMMHVTPPQGPPDVIKRSPLANAAGWVEVDDHTLQHTRYANVWSSGDCSSLPVSKTGAAVRKQVPVLVDNLIARREGRALTGSYDGYASCPLVTGRGKVILAEFGYGGKIMESFPFDQAQERYSMYVLKAYGLPKLYWHGMLRGRM
ncbi:MAG: FAD/NAD(P)-binding oxidoreductase [Nannocystaceae bacterium]